MRGDHGFFDAIDYTNRQPVSADEPSHYGRVTSSSCPIASRIIRA
jgi:hypothetical protein